jgi:hypothetical protein
MSNYICDICFKDFKQKSHYDDHKFKRKKPCFPSSIPLTILTNYKKKLNNYINAASIVKNNDNKCEYCQRDFFNIYSRIRHLETCKIKKKLEKTSKNEQNINLNNLIEEMKILKENNEKMEQKINKLEQKSLIVKNKVRKQNIETRLDLLTDNINKINNTPVTEHLVNMIVKQEKQIEEIKQTKEYKTNNKNINIIDDDNIDNNVFNDSYNLIKYISITLNGVIIASRSEDNYINATQLCQAGNKKFNDWFLLDSTIEFIKVLESESGIVLSQLIDFEKVNSNNIDKSTWIHPKLSINLAQWISIDFGLQVSNWIYDLLSNNKLKIDTNIKTKDKRIKLLEKMVLKKHKRTKYPEQNVIYIVTTDNHIINRTYIIGKAIDLTERLSTYNKTCEHKVIYYKNCNNEDEMNMIENMVLKKLDKYREQANRDRFILPIDNDIKLFTDIIDEAINFFNL